MRWSDAADLVDIINLVATLELSPLNQTERNTVMAVVLEDFQERIQDPRLVPLAVRLLAPKAIPKAPYVRAK